MLWPDDLIRQFYSEAEREAYEEKLAICIYDGMIAYESAEKIAWETAIEVRAARSMKLKGRINK
jgi:hypothetical protein